MADPMRKDDRHYTYADYSVWPPEERWELIDGVAYDMSPAPAPRHQLVLGELYAQFHRSLEGSRCVVFLAPFDVRLPDTPDEPDRDIRSVVQPDLTIVCDRGRIDDRGCRGAPDLAVEILSPSTAYKDQSQKFALYERHGVREFWIVNADRGTVEVYRLGAERRYGRPETYLATDKPEARAVGIVTIDLERVFQAL